MRLSKILTLIAIAGSAYAEVGVTDTTITIGQCAALSGAASGLGTGMNKGLNAWVTAVNKSGGIAGRTIKLVTADDAYDPDKCVEGTGKLIEEDKVFALSGYVGTPTSKVAIPIVTEMQVPLIGAFTGAGLLRKDEKTGKPHQWVINFRASYGDETEALVAHLTTDLGAAKIACFYQNDSFGSAGLAGTEAALKKRNLALVAKGAFERGTVAIKKGLADVMAGSPDAVVMVGPYKPIAAFLKEAKAAGLNARFATVSFVGTENLIAEAGEAGEQVVISQVVPSPADATVPLVKDYQEALHAAYPDEKPGYVSLEGYATARMLGLGLEKAGKDLSRANLVTTYEGLHDADLAGMRLSFSAEDHQGSDAVYLTQITAGSAKQVTALSK
jgi:ABC-type branched-subunit amino acid transport system substrate-binding protein